MNQTPNPCYHHEHDTTHHTYYTYARYNWWCPGELPASYLWSLTNFMCMGQGRIKCRVEKHNNAYGQRNAYGYGTLLRPGLLHSTFPLPPKMSSLYLRASCLSVPPSWSKSRICCPKLQWKYRWWSSWYLDVGCQGQIGVRLMPEWSSMR